MLKEKIGTAAGTVWCVLAEKEGNVEMTALKKATGLSEAEFNMAIGWLAREDKLVYSVEKKGRKNIETVGLKK